MACQTYRELEFEGLDVARFARALQRLIARHDMLRAVVRPNGEQQVLPETPSFPLVVTDFRGHDPQQVTAQLQQLRHHLSHYVLPADRWPLFAIRISRLEEQRYRLHISLDFLIGDGASLGIFFQELQDFYQDPERRLEPLTLTFRDYVLAEHVHQDSAGFQRARDYWLERLDTLPPAPELPLVPNHANRSQPRFVRRQACLEAELWQALKAQSTRRHLTPSGILLAIYAEILATWSKTPRFTINLTLFNRQPVHPQINEIIGDFTTTVLLAVDHAATESFAERAQRLQTRLWSDLKHRAFSGVRVLRELVRRQQGTSGVVMPVVFTSRLVEQGGSREATPHAPASEPQSGRFGDNRYGVSQTPQVWLNHHVAEVRGELNIAWDAVDELFPAGLLDDMFAAFQTLLRQLATDPDTWQSQTFSLVPSAQLATREAMNATAVPVASDYLHTLFQAQADRQPQHTAVVTATQTLSYGEVERRATHLGHRLRQLGARPNTLIGVVMEKGWEQVVAVLGILQSGAAYLPIDPELPMARQAYLIEHGEVELVLTQSWVEARQSWPAGVVRICVDREDMAGADVAPLQPVQRLTDLAYVIYTSGSTGQPKGVMIDHRGAVNTILDLNQRFAMGPADRVFAISSLSFDLSVYDLFGTLAAGGTIVMPPPSATPDPAHWLSLLH